MAREIFDGIIEAVRYTPEGLIGMVRAYQRRGAVWSDHILLGRMELMEKLQNGKRFVTGRRKNLLGNVFETGRVVQMGNEYIFTKGQSSQRDLLAGVPLF